MQSNSSASKAYGNLEDKETRQHMVRKQGERERVADFTGLKSKRTLPWLQNLIFLANVHLTDISEELNAQKQQEYERQKKLDDMSQQILDELYVKDTVPLTNAAEKIAALKAKMARDEELQSIYQEQAMERQREMRKKSFKNLPFAIFFVFVCYGIFFNYRNSIAIPAGALGDSWFSIYFKLFFCKKTNSNGLQFRVTMSDSVGQKRSDSPPLEYYPVQYVQQYKDKVYEMSLELAQSRNNEQELARANEEIRQLR